MGLTVFVAFGVVDYEVVILHPARARTPASRVCHTVGMDLVFGLPETARHWSHRFVSP